MLICQLPSMLERAALLVVPALLILVGVVVSGSEEPTTPTCQRFSKGSLSFCSMVDYVAVVDADDLDGAIADARAKFYYENVNVMLLRFGCHNKYSLYGCDDCRDAYKYWICSIKFQKCGNTGGAMETQLCPVGSSTCSEGVDGRYRTCLSLCEDVVRKCPYVLNFQCPTSQTSFFSTDITSCNKLDRTKNPDRPDKAWPGTFAES